MYYEHTPTPEAPLLLGYHVRRHQPIEYLYPHLAINEQPRRENLHAGLIPRSLVAYILATLGMFRIEG